MMATPGWLDEAPLYLYTSVREGKVFPITTNIKNTLLPHVPTLAGNVELPVLSHSNLLSTPFLSLDEALI